MRYLAGVAAAALICLALGALLFAAPGIADAAGILPTILGLGFLLAAVVLAGRRILRRRSPRA